MKISIIIPVYNVEPFLCQCIDSILAQTYKDFEVIFIDDGSHDRSGIICDKYAKENHNFHIVHQENKGSSFARNIGISLACGKYITFVDSDDWLNEDHLEKLIMVAEKEDADITLCDFYKNRDSKEEYIKSEPTSYDCNSLVIDALTGKIHAGGYTKLFKKQLFESHQLAYPPYNYYEDMFLFVSALFYSKKIAYSPFATYHYRYNESSLTHLTNIRKRILLYEEFILNMELLDEKFHLTDKYDLRKALFACINYNKRNLIKEYFNYPRYVKPVLHHFRNSFTLKDVKGIGDVFYYLASNYGILYPYSLKKKYHLGHE